MATCTENKCQCKPSQHLSSNKCEEQKGESSCLLCTLFNLSKIFILGIGEECSRAGECYMPQNPESIECRNSMCQCKIGYKPDRNVCKVRPKKSEFKNIKSY